MSGVQVECPKCRAGLKLPDRSSLGRKGKCPKCGHRFVLEDPDVVPLELVADNEPVAPAADTVRYVPDGGPASGPAAGNNEFNFDAAPPVGSGLDLGGAVPPGEDRGDSVLNKTRRRRKKSSPLPKVVGGVAAAVTLGVIIAAGALNGKEEARPENAPPAANAAYEAERAAEEDANAVAAASIPTEGGVIPVDYLPFTPHLLLHIQPDELWAADRSRQVFAASLINLGVWLQAAVKDYAGFEPTEIDEITFAVNFGPRMSEPEVAAVIRLKAAQTRSDLIRRVRGTRAPEYTAEIFDDGTRSTLIVDESTLVVCDSDLSESLAAARDYPPLPSPDMEPLLGESDRSRLMTLLFHPKLVDLHREEIFIPQMQQFADQFMIWLGSQVQAVSFSIHPTTDRLYVETLYRHTNDTSPRRLQKSLQGKLERLPETIQDMVEYMSPSTMGSRQLIGRFPVMIAALRNGTTTHAAGRFVRSVTVLPANAAPNLALGAMLTWDQSNLTDFTVVKQAPAETSGKPKTLREALDSELYIDFRREPLQGAMAYISEDIGVPIEIDGDGLKLAGFTQNMAQTFKLGDVRAKDAFKAIFTQYAEERDPLALLLDESGGKLVLTVKSRVAGLGLPEYPVMGD